MKNDSGQNRKYFLALKRISFILLSLFLFSVFNSEACTRLVYKGPNGTVITARTMDWKADIPANLWIFPRGIKRNGEIGKHSMHWTSRYGSIITSSYDISTTDGMNEKGLVANVLWLVESKYPKLNINNNQKGVAISAWTQYVLDNFATVKEAVEASRKEDFVIVSGEMPGTGMFTALHLSVSDSSGDNAIFEYIEGKLVIHHDPSYTVMTNSPIFEQQLAVSKYWSNIPGNIMLPGTNRATDRFVRAKYYLSAIPQTDNTRVAVASVMSVIRNCSVPFGISSKEEPNISSTRWRTLSDQKNLVYYFETALTPNTFWVNLKEIDFSEKGKVMKLSVQNNETYAGNALDKFVKSKPFQFAGTELE